jgi:hypothetical protein
MRPRGALGAVLGLWALAGASGCGTHEPARRPPVASPDAAPSHPTTPPEPAEAVHAAVKNAAGTVELGRSGSFTPLGPGSRLDKDDVIRTGPGASATVVMGEDIEIQLLAGSQVTLRELTATAARVRLENGRLGASVASQRTVLRIESASSSAVAEARRGRLAVFTDGRGLVAVTATAGEVKLTSSGGDTVIGAGERALVVRDAAPERSKVPASVFLKIKWPEATTAEYAVVVRGKAEVGSVVTVNGATAVVLPDGTFSARVPVTKGENPLQVMATDLAGRTASDKGSVTVVRTGPQIKVGDPIWK